MKKLIALLFVILLLLVALPYEASATHAGWTATAICDPNTSYYATTPGYSNIYVDDNYDSHIVRLARNGSLVYYTNAGASWSEQIIYESQPNTNYITNWVNETNGQVCFLWQEMSGYRFYHNGITDWLNLTDLGIETGYMNGGYDSNYSPQFVAYENNDYDDNWTVEHYYKTDIWHHETLFEIHNVTTFNAFNMELKSNDAVTIWFNLYCSNSTSYSMYVDEDVSNPVTYTYWGRADIYSQMELNADDVPYVIYPTYESGETINGNLGLITPSGITQVYTVWVGISLIMAILVMEYSVVFDDHGYVHCAYAYLNYYTDQYQLRYVTDVNDDEVTTITIESYTNEVNMGIDAIAWSDDNKIRIADIDNDNDLAYYIERNEAYTYGPEFNWVNHSPSTTANNNSAYTYTFTTNMTGEVYNVTTNATWLNMNPSTGVLSGTATEGIYYVNVTASYDGDTLHHDYILTVATTPYAWVSHSPETWNQLNEPYLYAFSTTKSGVVYSFTTNATWLSGNTSTGILSGTSNETGYFSVNVTATWHGQVLYCNYTILVEEHESLGAMINEWLWLFFFILVAMMFLVFLVLIDAQRRNW